MFRRLVILVILGIVPLFCMSQARAVHDRTLLINHIQLEDAHNYGLVFRGLGLGYSAGWSWINQDRLLRYRNHLGLTIMTRYEIPAADLRFSPGMLDYRWPINFLPGVSAGPALSLEYRYQFNPDLQSGHAYWFSHISLGGGINWHFRLHRQEFTMEARTSLVGFASRPPAYYDPYMWKISVPLILKYVNQDFRPGSWNRYNVSSIEFNWIPQKKSRIGFGYKIDYMGYFDDPRITIIDHSVKIIFLPKSKES